ncbi:MAG: hypothetical protein J6E46_13395 [Faecalicoccus sp.]|nr:hypothetical protein [Faecalicoccus sp.]
MSTLKRYPHLPNEDTILRTFCYEKLEVEYNGNPCDAAWNLLHKELEAIKINGFAALCCC